MSRTVASVRAKAKILLWEGIDGVYQVLADVLLRLVGLLVLALERGERVLERAHHLGRGLLRLAEERHRRRAWREGEGRGSSAPSTVNGRRSTLTLTRQHPTVRLPDCRTALPPGTPALALQPTARDAVPFSTVIGRLLK